MNKLRWTLSVSVLVLVAASAPPTAASTADPGTATSSGAATVDRTVRIVYQNIAGGSRGHGRATALKNVKDQMREYKPHVVMVVEICKSQLDAFKESRPEWHTRFTALRRDEDTLCQGVDADGNPRDVPPGSDLVIQGEMLASKYPMSGVTRTELSDDKTSRAARSFHLTCADVSLTGVDADALRACVTHLRAGHPEDADEAEKRSEKRAAQVRKIQETVRPFIKLGKRVIVAGDFNARPWHKELNRMYILTRHGEPTGLGNFAESDQTDKRKFATPPARFECPTSASACRSGGFTIGPGGAADRRYDYIFFSRPGARDLHGWVGAYGAPGTPLSDHRLVRGRATLSLLT